MTWFKVDDTFAAHPKVLDLGSGPCFAQAIALWTMAGAWCASQLTDGFVPCSALKRIVPFDGKKAAAELVRVGLWTKTDDGFSFWDWHHYQPTKVEVEVERTNSAKRSRKYREKHKDELRKKRGNHEIVTRDADVASHERHAAPSRPVPSVSLPTVENVRATLGWSDIVETYSRIRSEAWQKKTGNPGGRWKPGTKDHGGVASALELFRDEPEPQAALEDSIRGFMRDTWAAERDWPFSAWSRDPGRYRGKVVSGAVAGSTSDAIAEHDACVLRAEQADLRGDLVAKEAELRKAAEIRRASHERIKQVSA